LLCVMCKIINAMQYRRYADCLVYADQEKKVCKWNTTMIL
jgi:hypothetical protein